MKLYYHPASTTSRIVMMFAEEEGVKLDYQIVDLFTGEHLKPEFAKINPNCLVPVLEDGDFRLAGQVHSTVLRQGEAFHAQLVEQRAHGGDVRIRRVAVLGWPHPRWGEELWVVVESDEAGVEAGVRRRLEEAGIPCDELIVRGEPLPVDPRHDGKIDYGALRWQLGGEELVEEE